MATGVACGDALTVSGKLISGKTGRANQAPQSSFGNLLVVRHRKRRYFSFFCHNNVAASPARHIPTKVLENPHNFLPT